MFTRLGEMTLRSLPAILQGGHSLEFAIHSNILKLADVLGDIGQCQFTVSEWMVHGNVMQCIREHSTNRLELVRISMSRGDISLTEPRQQLHGTARGLGYLHDANLIHADLKGVRTTTRLSVTFQSFGRRTSS